MIKKNVTIPVFIPIFLLKLVDYLKRKGMVRRLNKPKIPNLLGDRDIEWSFIASQLPAGPGQALDFGSGGSFLGLMAADRGFQVTALDLRAVDWPYRHLRLQGIQGDILKLELPLNFYDLVINCSSIEHVGLAGRYGVVETLPDGDLDAMARLRALMKKDAVMLLTVPIGRDAVFPPLCRVYGAERLPRLLAGFTLKKEVFWVKDSENRWFIVDKENALRYPAAMRSFAALQNISALGCFVLQRQ